MVHIQNSNVAAVREAIFDLFMLVHYGRMDIKEETVVAFR
jgi:hypothetical protein